jgi:hypothetical protein
MVEIAAVQEQEEEPQFQPQPQVKPVEPEVQVVPSQEAAFDPNSISREVFANAKTDIQNLVNDLNRIIRARNYNAWIGYLADSYLATISSQGFLDEKTEDLYKRDQVVANNLGRDPRQVEKRVLKSPRDYFSYVVIPSRSNDRVDDIAFITGSRVRAYTIDTKGNRLVLYDLALVGDDGHGRGKWLIIN